MSSVRSDNFLSAERGIMKTLIVYYSLEGNTEFAAEKIAKTCGFETLRLVPVKKYPDSGF